MENNNVLDNANSILGNAVRNVLSDIVRDAVRAEINSHKEAQPQRNIVSGIKNISNALSISERKVVDLIKDGTLKDSIRRNGNVYLCDVDKAFDELMK